MIIFITFLAGLLPVLPLHAFIRNPSPAHSEAEPPFTSSASLRLKTANANGTIREYYPRGLGIAADVGSLVAETRFENNAPVITTYLHSNWRGDVVMATDTSGNVIGAYDYTTYGEMLCPTGTYTPRFTFSSKERDASGLVYFGSRYYSPILCRWISEDPIGEEGGLNLYQFAGNNPVNWIAPYGLSCDEYEAHNYDHDGEDNYNIIDSTGQWAVVFTHHNCWYAFHKNSDMIKKLRLLVRNEERRRKRMVEK